MIEGKIEKHRKKASDLRNKLEAVTESRDSHVGDMYVDGMTVKEISEATGLPASRVYATVKALRASGRPMDRKVVRRTGLTWGDRRRRLTDHEVSVLRSLDASVPRTAGGHRVMASPEGAVLMDEVVRLVDSERVVIGAVSSALGVTRQGMQMHLVNRKLARATA